MRGALLAAAGLAALLLAAACGESGTGPSGSGPAIEELSTEADSIAPGTTLEITVTATDPDTADSLIYTWSATGGTFGEAADSSTVSWTAPGTLGAYSVTVTVSDGGSSAEETLLLTVTDPLAATISSPDSGAVFHPDSSIVFSGFIEGFSGIRIRRGPDRRPRAARGGDIAVEWVATSTTSSDTLHDTPPREEGTTSFATLLSYGRYDVTLHAELRDTLWLDSLMVNPATGDTSLHDSILVYRSSATTLVHVSDPPAIQLNPPERNYLSNRLSWQWTPFEGDTDHWGAFVVLRGTDPADSTDVTEVARLDAAAGATWATRSWVDSAVVLGQSYLYRVVAENEFGVRDTSAADTIATGVFTEVDASRIGDMVFGSGDYDDYLFASVPSAGQVWVLDVTANNLDYQVDVGSAPWGLAWAPGAGAGAVASLWVANSESNSLSRVTTSTMQEAETVSLPRAPLYLDHSTERQRLYVTTLGPSLPSALPLIVYEDLSGWVVTSFSDEERLHLLADSSLLRVDDEADLLYLSEIGGFPASMLLYDISALDPAFLAEDEHQSLGYNLQDFAVVPDDSTILTASQSPYEVQLFHPDLGDSTFVADPRGPLATGPSPNAVTVNSEGTTAYTATGVNAVNIWSLADASTPLAAIQLAEPVVRDGIEVSPDDNYLVIATYHAGEDRARLYIVYLGS